MPLIDPSRDLNTVVVEITVEPEKQEEWVRYIDDMTRKQAGVDGFISCSIHKSVDGTRVLEYIQWETAEKRMAAFDSEEGHRHLATLEGISTVRTYTVSNVVEPASNQ